MLIKEFYSYEYIYSKNSLFRISVLRIDGIMLNYFFDLALI